MLADRGIHERARLLPNAELPCHVGVVGLTHDAERDRQPLRPAAKPLQLLSEFLKFEFEIR
jgi:hypothetical protein